ncbi:hypothetical protein VTL71DRAFT_6229 [Oculimacula yallundae]|uniref:Uncharacterized protein n=1 Tax=Oculimacula yallundae TaxID=86028 RepID=A0ABR4BZW0_9HELO
MNFKNMHGFAPSSSGSSKLWDPSKVLEIINPDPAYQCITCAGQAPSQGRRCRVAISAPNRKTITDTINEISYLNPNDPRVMSRLSDIAGVALCLRFHQSQKSSILATWRNKIPRTQRVDSDGKSKSPQSEKRKQAQKEILEQMRVLRDLMATMENNWRAAESEYSSDEDETTYPPASFRSTSKSDTERYRAQLHSERLERERLAREQGVRDKRAAEEELLRRQQAQERVKRAERAEKAARERQKAEEQERIDRQHAEKLRKEQQAKAKRDAENAASNERMRQNAKARAEKTAREKREQEQKEQMKWDQSWTRYQEQWITFKISASRNVALRDAIPWPVQTGVFGDVNASTVRTFLKKGLPEGVLRRNMLRKECSKWHPDAIGRWSRAAELTDVERIMIDMICRLVTDEMNLSSKKSSDYF